MLWSVPKLSGPLRTGLALLRTRYRRCNLKVWPYQCYSINTCVRGTQPGLLYAPRNSMWNNVKSTKVNYRYTTNTTNTNTNTWYVYQLKMKGLQPIAINKKNVTRSRWSKQLPGLWHAAPRWCRQEINVAQPTQPQERKNSKCAMFVVCELKKSISSSASVCVSFLRLPRHHQPA